MRFLKGYIYLNTCMYYRSKYVAIIRKYYVLKHTIEHIIEHAIKHEIYRKITSQLTHSPR